MVIAPLLLLLFKRRFVQAFLRAGLKRSTQEWTARPVRVGHRRGLSPERPSGGVMVL
jgi:hypothetical protein